jgi:hypothetical protein
MRAPIGTWRVVAVALLAAAVQAAPAQADWRDVAVRDSPRSAIASCLRATGAPGLVGLLGPLEGKVFRYDLLRAASDSITPTAGVSLGELLDCPAVAAAPIGQVVVAAGVNARRQGAMRVALAEPDGSFGPPATLASGHAYPQTPVAAISPRGDAVVAWIARHEPDLRRGGRTTSRVVAALRPAGGSFGKPEFLTAPRSIDYLTGQHLAAAMDASGTATVAWAHPNVAVATARAGGTFGAPQTLTRGSGERGTLGLAVAPDGAALFAYGGTGAIHVLERRAGSDRFERLITWRSSRDSWEAPVLALAPDGSAVVGWRTDDPFFSTRVGVVMAERRAHAAFSKPQVVWPDHERADAISVEVILTTRGGVDIPLDDDNRGLDVALAADGRYLLTWALQRRAALGDSPARAAIARGVIGAAPGPVRLAGCRCRDVNGVAALELPDGRLGVAYTDNVTSWFSPLREIPRAAGRVHVAAPGAPVDQRPPGVAVSRPPPATLGYDQAIEVTARCTGPCDLRAYVVGARGPARGVGTARLRQAGRTRIRIRPSSDGHLAPRSGERARVLVRAWTPGGRSYSQAVVPVVLRRAPLRPLASLLEARAVRRGHTIVVTWRTSRPVQRDYVFVEGLDAHRRSLGPYAFATPNGKTHFRVRLRLSRGVDVDEVHWVSLTLVRGAPPHDRKRIFVPVAG